MSRFPFKLHVALVGLAGAVPLGFLAGADETAPKPPPPITHPIMECLPSRLQARVECRNRFQRALPPTIGGHAPRFVVNITKRWQTAQTVRVAFKGGTPALHGQIEEATKDWTNVANLQLDFGKKPDGSYRTWSASDMTFAAEVRISFDQTGYYSLVGTDGTNPAVTRPSEESMNFQGFDQQLPSDWRAVVLHEFGHALGFEHEHQHPTEGCDSDFRWEDDPGYVPSTDQFGQFVQDSQGRRPGIYTVLGGPPNNWPKAMVDFNLRQLPESHAYQEGPFDKTSIMKYFFPVWMFVQGDSSHCFSVGENLVLSDQDKAGVKLLYPHSAAQVEAQNTQRRTILEALTKIKGLHPLSQKHYASQLQLMTPKGSPP
jgi:hypothetical protein